MKRILFQGDSITDAARSRENDFFRGNGYATLVSATLGYERPGEFEFLNRGISGNRSIDILARVKSDIINLKPDYISILMGINDIWHEFDYDNGVDSVLYEKYYNMLISQIKEALPAVKIMILEPFSLKGTGNEVYWDKFEAETRKMAEASKRVAKEHGLVFVPLMDLFFAASKKADASYWLFDGVHPTAMGHELIKREWLKAFNLLESGK